MTQLAGLLLMLPQARSAPDSESPSGRTRLALGIDAGWAWSRIVVAEGGQSAVELRGPVLGGAGRLGWRTPTFGVVADLEVFRWWASSDLQPVGIQLSPLLCWTPFERLELAAGPSAMWLDLGVGAYRNFGGHARAALHTPLGGKRHLVTIIDLRGGWVFSAVSVGFGIEG